MSKPDQLRADNALRQLDRLTEGRVSYDIAHFVELLMSEAVPLNMRHGLAEEFSASLSKIIHQLSLQMRDPQVIDHQTKLWRLRNQVVHGIHRNGEKYDDFHPVIWSELERIGTGADPVGFEKMMAFCFGDFSLPPMAKSLQPGQVVGLYRDHFFELSDKEKEIVFRNLLVRMFGPHNVTSGRP